MSRRGGGWISSFLALRRVQSPFPKAVLCNNLHNSILPFGAVQDSNHGPSLENTLRMNTMRTFLPILDPSLEVLLAHVKTVRFHLANVRAKYEEERV